MARKRKPNKRIQKKKATGEVAKKLSSHGIPEKKQKRMLPDERKKAIQKVNKSERAKALKQEKKDFLKNHGISNYTINGKNKGIDSLSTLSWEQIKQITDTKKKELQREKNRIYRENTLRNKKRYLRQKGIPESRISEYAKGTYKEIDSKIDDFFGDRTVYKTKEFLSIMWADVTGESNMSFIFDENKDMSTDEIIEAINDIYMSALEAEPDSSDDFRGVASIMWGSEPEVETERREQWWKGYRDKLVTSNEFTLRGFANIMLSIMRRTKPEFIVDYYSQMETFASQHLPEIHAKIFG